MAVVTSLKNFGIRAFNTRRLIFKGIYKKMYNLIEYSDKILKQRLMCIAFKYAFDMFVR